MCYSFGYFGTIDHCHYLFIFADNAHYIILFSL